MDKIIRHLDIPTYEYFIEFSIYNNVDDLISFDNNDVIVYDKIEYYNYKNIKYYDINIKEISDNVFKLNAYCFDNNNKLMFKLCTKVSNNTPDYIIINNIFSYTKTKKHVPPSFSKAEIDSIFEEGNVITFNTLINPDLKNKIEASLKD